MKNKIFLLFFAGAFVLTTGCLGDLDTIPLDPAEITSASVYEDPGSYKQVLAKLYAGLALSGQKGPDGQADISGIDEGFSTYIRQYWKAQELSTDEAVIAWNDGNIHDFHQQDWDANNEFITAMYNRIFYQISLCNEFLRESTDEKLDSRNVDASLRTEIGYYRAEARFLRALSYWHALDMFRNVPFVTEEDAVGAFFPEQINKTDLFAFVESELLEIETLMVAPMMNEYGRADQGAAWTVLAKLYLNANVYLGTDRNSDCVAYCKKIIDAGYALHPNYQELFLADNNQASGIIFPVSFDGIHTKTWGGMTFVISASIGGSMDPAEFGVGGGWGGTRTTKQIVEKFPDMEADSRALFYTDGQNLEIEDISLFTEGYAIGKFKNVNSDGSGASDNTHPDTDFPMFRIADVYLMYAEAIVRGGTGGDLSEATTLVNSLRERAFGDDSQNISTADLDLAFLIDERARELHWECHRRTDLIRFGQFSETTYTWAWKGGVPAGKSTDALYDVFPIPASDIGANPNLQQNDGYN